MAAFSAIFLLYVAIRIVVGMEKTVVSGENYRLTPRPWQLSHMLRLGFEPCDW